VVGIERINVNHSPTLRVVPSNSMTIGTESVIILLSTLFAVVIFGGPEVT
jgi:hypothetical protein